MSRHDSGALDDFQPVPTRSRHDGWTPERQHDFIAALAQSGCVEEACAAVGMSVGGAYRLRARPDASAFRQSWDIALDFAVRRITDAAFARAIHGVTRPIFYQGEQIGERRTYDERLAMFLMRYRDPVRYGAWLDHMEARRHPDGPGIVLAHALNSLLAEAHGDRPLPPDGDPGVPPDPAYPPPPLADGPPRTRVALPDYDGPEELRGLAEQLRAASTEPAEGDDDPAVDDWLSPLVTHRPGSLR